MQAGSQDTWLGEPVERIISETVNDVLGIQLYKDERVTEWNDEICKMLMTRLIDQKKPMKYSVECMIMQKTGTGIHSATASYFDNSTDGQISYIWPKEKSKDHPNKFIVCLVTVLGTSLSC